MSGTVTRAEFTALTARVAKLDGGPGGVVTPPPPPPAPAVQVVKAGDLTAIRTTDGHTLDITPAGVIRRDSQPIPGGDGSGAVGYDSATNSAYGQDAVSGIWWAWDAAGWSQTQWKPPGTVVTPPPPPPPVGTRRACDIPFASTSVFNLPLGNGAVWQANAQLQAIGTINMCVSGNWNIALYTGTASDPLVAVTCGTVSVPGDPPAVVKVHIPAGAMPDASSDGHLGGYDAVQNLWYAFGNVFQWTGPNTATAGYGGAEPANGDGLGMHNSDWDTAVGVIRPCDLAAKRIDHMLRCSLPGNLLLSVNKTDGGSLPANAWPQTKEDWYGPENYSGTIPYGMTLGIPWGVAEPADVAANPGAHILWVCLQTHGCMIRDSGGGGSMISFYGDQNVSQSDPLIQGMSARAASIMPHMRILANQGPNSINGGGTPVVPLIAALAP